MIARANKIGGNILAISCLGGILSNILWVHEARYGTSGSLKDYQRPSLETIITLRL